MSTINPKYLDLGRKAATYIYVHRGAIKKKYKKLRKRSSRKPRYKMRTSKRKRKSYVSSSKRRKIGNRIGTSSCKKNSSWAANPAIPVYQLEAAEISDLTKGTSIADTNMRWRQIANVRGWKINMELENVLSNGTIYVNVAVIALKDGAGSFSGGTNVPDFFRGLITERSVNFNSLSLGQDHYTRSINSDKFIVLKRHKFLLAPNTGPPTVSVSQNPNLSSYKNLNFYVPLKRQLRYKDSTGSTAESRVFCVWWCADYANLVTTPTVNPALRVTRRITTYFREPKVC